VCPVKVKPGAPAANTTHAIALDPIDWFWAPWRQPTPLLRPAPAPFDPVACAARRERVKVGRQGRSYWPRAEIAPALTTEEARFWFESMLPNGQSPRPLDHATILARLRENVQLLRPEIVLPLTHFLSAEDVLELLLGEQLVSESSPFGSAPARFARGVLRDGFRRYLLPYLDRSQRNRLRALLRGRLDLGLWPSDARPVPVVFSLAAALGMHAELLPLVQSWPDHPPTRRTFLFQNNERQNVVFGLDGPEQVLEHLRRLRLRPLLPDHARAWLAHAGLGALDWLRDTIQALPKKEQATRLLEVLCLVRAPEAAPHMLEVKLRSSVPRLARQWLDEHMGLAVAGLVPVAAGRGKIAEAALEYLVEARRRGHAQLVEEHLRSLPSGVADRMRRDLPDGPEARCEPFLPQEAPDWFHSALAEAPAGKKERLPDWLRPAWLPPVVVGDRCLNDDQTQAMLGALRRSALASPQPLVRAVRQHASPASLAGFAWKLAESWLDDGMPTTGTWALNALGFFGDDSSVSRVMELLPGWRDREGQQRARTALECLAAIGTDSALLQLQRIARDANFKDLQVKAWELLDAVAAQRRVKREQLEDRIAPGLAPGGVFDFGRRQFRLVLGADLRPRLMDGAGRLKNKLPTPTAREARKAEAVVRQWELLKQHLRETLKVQALRLEEAMLAGRRWPADAFESLLAHPLLGPLARRLVWGGYDGQGRLAWCFRAEEGHCVGLEGGPCPVDAVQTVGIVHPLYLTEEERLAWREALGADESQPFAQLSRKAHHLEPDKEEQADITWFSDLAVPSSFLWRLLAKQGWRRAGYELGVGGWAYMKALSGGRVTAVFELEGAGPVGPAGRHELLRIQRCYFLNGPPSPAVGQEAPLPLGRVDPVILSEVLSDLNLLASKGQVMPAPPPPPPQPAARAPFYSPPTRPMPVPAALAMGADMDDDIPF
jgi:hypothetical protein